MYDWQEPDTVIPKVVLKKVDSEYHWRIYFPQMPLRCVTILECEDKERDPSAFTVDHAITALRIPIDGVDVWFEQPILLRPGLWYTLGFVMVE